MLILRFSVSNHKSLRDEALLDMVSSRLKKQQPDDGDWAGVVHPVAAIYGPNGSGKTTLLDALGYMCDAVKHSASSWLAQPSIPQHPFRLDRTSASRPSSYTLDFVHENTRFVYGFDILEGKVAQEWLSSYPRGRERVLFARSEDGVVETGPHLPNPGSLPTVTDRELLISRSLISQHAFLAPLAEAVCDGIEYHSVDDARVSLEVSRLASRLEAGAIDPEALSSLLRVADVGVKEVTPERSEMPREVRRFREMLAHAIADDSDEPSGPTKLLVASDDSFAEIKFSHSDDDEVEALGVGDESRGTIAWMVLASSALTALRRGTVLVIDEVDSSLHPYLVTVLIGLFLDQGLNTRGAQLVFTTHDVTLMQPSNGTLNDPEYIWFTEKDNAGATTLTCLDQFSPRMNHNWEKRYLEGRYGAVPRTMPSLVRAFVLSHGEDTERDTA